MMIVNDIGMGVAQGFMPVLNGFTRVGRTWIMVRWVAKGVFVL